MLNRSWYCVIGAVPPADVHTTRVSCFLQNFTKLVVERVIVIAMKPTRQFLRFPPLTPPAGLTKEPYCITRRLKAASRLQSIARAFRTWSGEILGWVQGAPRVACRWARQIGPCCEFAPFKGIDPAAYPAWGAACMPAARPSWTRQRRCDNSLKRLSAG
jgi:hypothetical protein